MAQCTVFSQYNTNYKFCGILQYVMPALKTVTLKHMYICPLIFIFLWLRIQFGLQKFVTNL